MVESQESKPVRQVVVDAISRVLRDSGRAAPDPVPDSAEFATDLKLDSLDLAVLVVALEADLGVDPFRAGVAPVRTLGELVLVYENAYASKDHDDAPGPSDPMHHPPGS